MAEFSKLMITNKGQELMAKMIAGTGVIHFTKICASSTQYTQEQVLTLTALDEIKQTNLVSKVTRTNRTAVKIDTAYTNEELTEGYYMRTLGLYAQDPDAGEILYAATIETSGNCYMPPYNGVTVTGAYLQLITTVGNTESVSLEVTPGAYATVGDVRELGSGLQNLKEQMKKYFGNEDSSGDIGLAEGIQADTVVGAINEVFTLGNERKQKLVENLVAMGVPASASESWQVLLDKVLDMTDTSNDTVTAETLLAGYTAHNAAGQKVTGTLADKSQTTDYDADPSLDTLNSRLKLKIPSAGKYGPGNYLYTAYSTIASLIGLTASKLVKGHTILGVSGSSSNMDTSGADAAASEILSGKKAGVKGSMLTGSMANQGAWTGATTGNGNVAIPAGYHNGSGYVSGAGAYDKGISDADARENPNSANYKNGYQAGVNATKTGTAGTDDVLSGKTFTNADSVGASGTMANKGGVTVDAGTVTQDNTYTYLAIPTAGFYNTESKVRALNSNINTIDRFQQAVCGWSDSFNSSTKQVNLKIYEVAGNYKKLKLFQTLFVWTTTNNLNTENNISYSYNANNGILTLDCSKESVHNGWMQFRVAWDTYA